MDLAYLDAVRHDHMLLYVLPNLQLLRGVIAKQYRLPSRILSGHRAVDQMGTICLLYRLLFLSDTALGLRSFVSRNSRDFQACLQL